MAIEVPEGHDRSAKRLLGHPKVVADLLRAFVPEQWLEGIDYEGLRPSFTEHVDTGFAKRIGDIAWTTSYDGGGELAILIEAQSTCDHAMAPRMSTLASMLAEHRARRTPEQPLPNLLPIVYYTGRAPWTASTDLANMIDSRQAALPFMRRPCYLLIDAGRIVSQSHMPKRNTASLMMRMEAATDGRELLELLKSSTEWLGSEDRALWFDYLHWANRVLIPLRFPSLKLDGLGNYLEGIHMLAENMRDWLERETERRRLEGLAEGRVKGQTLGRKEGRKEGRLEGRKEGQSSGQRELLHTLASKRFGDEIAKHLSTFLDKSPDPARFTQVGEWILDCRTDTEFLQRLSSTH